MKVLVDMNLSPRWTSFLVEAGFEAKHWSVIGADNALDTEIMSFARGAGFVVLTHDLDFGAILAATGRKKPSVVQIRTENNSPEAIGQFVVKAMRQMKAEIEEGALLTIEPERTRLRLLPFVTD